MQYPVIDLIAQAYLNNGWTGLDISMGKNLFDKNTIRPQTWVVLNTTNIEPTTGPYLTSNYIRFNANETFYVPQKGSSRNAIFDINKNGIEYFSHSGGAFTFPFDGFIVLTISNDTNLDTYQVEKGNIPTPYEPYNPNPSNDFPNRLKLPLPHYFPHPVIDALQRAAAGTQTADDTEILRHYLTPLGIGGI